MLLPQDLQLVHRSIKGIKDMQQAEPHETDRLEQGWQTIGTD
jgi:hypothetical protein